MRVAALYDIHGNPFALDAVLEEISRLQVDLIVVGGDVVWGPFPRATLDRLSELGEKACFIRGNADREVGRRLGPAAGLDAQISEINAFCAAQIPQDQLTWLSQLPLTRVETIDGLGDVLFCHASPRSDEEILTPATPDEDIRSAAGAWSGVIVCGHTHVQFDHTVGDVRLVNAGSVGMPYEDSPGAYWVLLDSNIIARRTPYDIEGAAEAFASSGCPHVEAVFVDKLLDPPGRKATLERFESIRAGTR